METPRPWVPLRILGLGLDPGEVVQADVFLLTDVKPDMLAGGDGLDVERSELASDLLLSDLRSDVGMEWVPERAWLTHLSLDEEAGDLTYDLSATGGPDQRPSTVDAGLRLGSFEGLRDAVRLTTDDGGPAARSVALVVATAGAIALMAAATFRTRHG
jgi:hypothetical protein